MAAPHPLSPMPAFLHGGDLGIEGFLIVALIGLGFSVGVVVLGALALRSHLDRQEKKGVQRNK